MLPQEIKLTNDPLANIHIMAPMLDTESRRDALVYMLGLLSGAKHKEKQPDQPERKTG